MCQKILSKRYVDLLPIREEVKRHFLSNILIHLFMIIHYTVEEKIFVIIVYKLLVQKNIKTTY